MEMTLSAPPVSDLASGDVRFRDAEHQEKQMMEFCINRAAGARGKPTFLTKWGENPAGEQRSKAEFFLPMVFVPRKQTDPQLHGHRHTF